MTTTHKILVTLVVAGGLFLLGRASVGSAPDDSGATVAEGATDSAADAAPTLWTCPMHPQFKLPDPGDCPICGMDLVPLTASGEDHPRRMTMSADAKALARIETVRVRRDNVSRPVRMVGKVDYDETRVRTISAWVAGRLDRLYVDYNGVPVQEGEHLVWLFSPELLTAQEELLSAKQRVQATAGEESGFLADSNRRAYEAARDKLLLWGLTEEQVTEVEERGEASDHVMITSPTSGVVIDKLLDEGEYVRTGTPIYRIADLDELWIVLDAYEQDLAWLRYGQNVVLEVAALPGEFIEGKISQIHPTVDERTRTAMVRVNVDNRNGRLKPGMFVRGVAVSRLGAGGAVIDSGLAGKWVSPMHPEIVKDEPGQCDVCGMDLVPAEELGLVDDVPLHLPKPLVVPTSAVLVTGERAVVYVELPDREEPTYEGREVVLGPRAGDEYIVQSGLEEGERVVVNGAFRIDSAMQIQAKPSMMSMHGRSARPTGPEALVFRRTLSPLYAAYFALQEALAGDDLAAARGALDELEPAWGSPSASGLQSRWRTQWTEERGAGLRAVASARDAEDLDALRAAFEDVSRAVLAVVRVFGHADGATWHEAHCPMAFDDRGASWLQDSETIANPYFGASMLRCGELRDGYVGSGESDGGAAAEAPPEAADHDHDHDGAASDDAHRHERDEANAPGSVDEELVDRAVGDGSAMAGVVTAYLDMQVALAGDDAPAARDAARALDAAVDAARAEESEHDARLAALGAALDALAADAEIDALRTSFLAMTLEVLPLVEATGSPLAEPLVVVHCPMAFDFEGADWLQLGETVANPYFGSEMLRCGSVQREVGTGN